MNMKKRSQSSLRSKTLQSQDDHNEINYWMGNLQAKKILNKVGQKITSSMIECNKQNQQINISQSNSQVNNSQFNTPIYQSVYQQQKSINHTPVRQINNKSQSKDTKQKLITNLQERCKKLQKQLSQIYTKNYKTQNNQLQITPLSLHHQSNPNLSIYQYPQPQQQSQFQSQTKQYNYIQKYYETQLESLKNQKKSMQEQLQKYHKLYQSKQQQLSDINQGISQRIQKQCSQKNILVKQINSNIIQIKRLKQQITLHKSQKQTLKIKLKQKQTIIQQQTTIIAQIQIRRKKIEGYQTLQRESQAVLNQIQLQMNKLKNEAQKKDITIFNSNKKINTLENKLLQYQEQINKLQKSIIAAKQNSAQNASKIKQIQQQCQQWKNKYCQAKQQAQQIPQLYIKIKNTQLTIDELQSRMKQLISSNQKLKIQVGNNQILKSKTSQQQKQINNLKKLLRQKCQQLQIYENNNMKHNGLLEELEMYKNKYTILQRNNQEKQQQLRLLKVKNQEKQHKLNNLLQELQETTKERIRIKQLQSKIDILFVENQKLHCSLLQKINQIEEIQKKLNISESKNISLTNQCTKIKAMYQGVSIELSQWQSKLQNMKNRWETQMGAKLGLQEKCNRLNKDIVNLKSKIENMEQVNESLKERQQQMIGEFQEKQRKMVTQIDELNSYKKYSMLQLENANKKVQSLHSAIKQLKLEIDRQMSWQKESMAKINYLQFHITDLQEQIKLKQNQLANTKKLWVQVQQMAGVALSQLK